MARRIPYLFCRYELLVDEERLNVRGQLEALTELQGMYFAHGPKAEREERLDSVLMRPRQFKIEGARVLSWSVGQRLDLRVAAEYDNVSDKLTFRTHNDMSVRYADFVAVPDLGALAVDDRAGPVYLGGKAAIRRFQSIFRNVEGGEACVYHSTSKEDVDHALEVWNLQELSFLVRPYNPHPVGDLSRRLSEQLEADGIGRYAAKAKPVGAHPMKPSPDGHLEAAIEMADAGYGQFAIKGVTTDGHEATIKKQRFSDQAEKNRKQQDEQRELRIHISVDDEADEELPQLVAKAMVEFYGD